MRILVTGATGFIGRRLCPFLRARGFAVTTFDGRLEDPAALRAAAPGIDTIVHLAACADEADFLTRLVPANVVGVFHVFEAARLARVRRVILASSCLAAYPDGRPADLYGLTKLWAEEMGELYSRTHGLGVLAARLGWVVRNESERSQMAASAEYARLYLSARDLDEFFHCALRAPATPFDVVYALSRPIAGALFDMEPARRLLGFEPKDTFPDGLSLAG